MRGMYVDQNGCMVLVLITGEYNDVSQYTVHGTTATHPNDEWTASCELSSSTSKVAFIAGGKDESVAGTRNDKGDIVWEGGDTWRPVHMSPTQFAFLTCRPYVPITFVFFAALNNLFLRVKALVKKTE